MSEVGNRIRELGEITGNLAKLNRFLNHAMIQGGASPEAIVETLGAQGSFNKTRGWSR